MAGLTLQEASWQSCSQGWLAGGCLSVRLSVRLGAAMHTDVHPDWMVFAFF